MQPLVRTAWLVVAVCFVTACGDAPPAPVIPDDPAQYLPMEEGRSWSYRVEASKRSWPLSMRRYGGDVRQVDGERVPYEFTYGRPDDTNEDRAKSIYAAPPTGLQEFYVDGYRVSIQHQPPVALLPEARVGVSWRWKGTLSVNREESDLTTKLRVVARERITVPAGTLEALRVEERSDDGAVRITRWFVKGVGMAKLDVEAPAGAFRFELASFAPPKGADAE